MRRWRSARLASSTRPACGPTGSAPSERRRGRGPADPPEPRDAPDASTTRTSRSAPARSCRRAAGGRSSRCPGSAARSSARPTTTTRASSSTSRRPPTDVDYLLAAVNDFFGTRARARPTHRRVRRRAAADLDRRPKKSVDISRKAELYETSSGMITITGGKLTTWRRMAKMTVDRLVEREARDAPCRTQEIPLGQPIAPDELPRVDGVPTSGLRGARRALRPRGARGASRRRGAAGARGADRRRAARPSRRGAARRAASRRGASATCCCGARGWACSPPAR